MRHLTVLIKPASSLCNLRCRYCFYHSVAAQRNQASYGVMTRETATALIGRALDASSSVTFSFQGGEPTLAGIDFFRFFIDEAKARNRTGALIQYSIQTNGMNLSDDFAAFLNENKFLAGISLDGPKDVNDIMRVDTEGKSVYKRALDAAALLDRHGVPYNILCVVHSSVARHIEKVYGFFRSRGLAWLQFIPCLDPLGSPPFSQKHSLTPELYADFLIRLFRVWADDLLSGQRVSIRFFDNLLQVAAGYPSEQCGMQGRCPGQIVVEGDGSIFPCDFFSVDNWRIGNINDMPIEEAYASPVMQRFIATSAYHDAECRDCAYYMLCRGGCRRDRDPALDGSAGANVYCGALKRFYAEAAPRLPELLRRITGC